MNNTVPLTLDTMVTRIKAWQQCRQRTGYPQLTLFPDGSVTLFEPRHAPREFADLAKLIVYLATHPPKPTL